MDEEKASEMLKAAVDKSTELMNKNLNLAAQKKTHRRYSDVESAAITLMIMSEAKILDITALVSWMTLFYALGMQDGIRDEKMEHSNNLFKGKKVGEFNAL